jgi:hypothetical protein
MSVDAFPFLLELEPSEMTSLGHGLTDRQVQVARAALQRIGTGWALDCHESSGADVHFDLSSIMPNRTTVSFILYARDGTIRVLKMVDDDYNEFGSFGAIDDAVVAIVRAIALVPLASTETKPD